MIIRLLVVASVLAAVGVTVKPVEVAHKTVEIPSYVMPLPSVEWPGKIKRRLAPQAVPGYDRSKKWQCVGECLWI